MTVELFTGGQRLALLVAAGVFALLAALLAWRRARAQRTAGAVTAAAIPLVLLVIERAIAWIVSAEAPAQTDFNEYRWVMLSPWGRIGLAAGAAACVVIVVLGWLGTAGVRSPWRRAAMMSLRAAAALCALVLFLAPAVELRQVAREPNRIAILVDDSLSMSLRDRTDGPTRAERARALIDGSRSTFATWRREHTLEFYTFGEELSPATEETAGTAAPKGRATLVRQALEQVRSRYDGADLAGVVLISDGIATGELGEEGGEGEARDFLRSLETNVHTAWAGREGLKDLSVAAVLADEFAFVRTVVRVKAVIRSTGFGARRVPVTLSLDGEPVRRKWVELDAGDAQAEVTFEFTPQRVGKYVYQVSTPVEDGEAVAENNSRSFVLRVIRDKIRVLQVAGQPSYDVRSLRGMLKQNPNVDLISFFILRTATDISNAPNSELSLIPFPTHELFEEELPSFDVIVLQNFNYAPYGISPYLDNIRRYVEGGGGLVMLGGALSFASGQYSGTPVAEALPVELPDAMQPPSELLDTGSFRARLTDLGRGHPITALRHEARDNEAAWKALPELEGVNLLVGPKDGSTVLAVHPTLTTRRGEPMPVIVAGDHGEGRTLAITTDSMWRWGFVAAARTGDDGRAYFRLWENAIRWLIHDPDLEQLRVQSDEVEYEPGRPIRIEVRLLDRTFAPLAGGEVKLELARGADPRATEIVAEESLKTGPGGDATLELPGLPPGVYRARARSEIDGRSIEGGDIFLVREAAAELEHPAADDRLLRAIAETTGGRYLGQARSLPADLSFEEPRIVRVDSRTDVEIWSRPALLLLALLFLGLEWFLRQRSGSR